MKTKQSFAGTTSPMPGHFRTGCAARLLPLLLCALPATVHAQDYENTANNGTITITRYNGPGGALTIPGTINGLPVTGIGDEAFYDTRLTSVTIPNSVSSIGHGAFASCTSLTSVTIPNSVTNIGAYAFLYCNSLMAITVDALNSAYSSVGGALMNKSQTTLIQWPGGKAGIYGIPNNVTSILGGAFSGCTGLTNITIPNSVTNIGSWAFGRCASLTAITVDTLNSDYSSVDGVLFNKSQTTLIQCPGGKTGSYTIPNSVTSIGSEAFSSCTSLTNVTIGNSVASIGDRAFSVSTSLINVTIGNSVINIGDQAFDFCTSLTSVRIPDSVTTIGDEAFFDCSSLRNVTVGDSVTSIGERAFSYCSSLINVTIPNSVTSVGVGAFDFCTSLTSVTIGNNVISLGDQMFYFCTSLTNVTIGNSVTYVGNYVFDSCTSLAAITVNALNSAYSSEDGVLFDVSQMTLIRCPMGKAGNYTISNGVTSVGSFAFSFCTKLTKVTIPNSITSIGDRVFAYCNSLKGVYFQGNAPRADYDLFDGANNAIVYYLPGTTGWGTTFGGRPTALWKPQVQTSDAGFGVRTNQFGFIITWASGMVIVVEVCTNLVNPTWSPVKTNTLGGDSFDFRDPQWTNYPGRFYRIRSP